MSIVSQPPLDGEPRRTVSSVTSGSADTSAVASPLKWHGGKSDLARRIVELMPAHTHYVEPFFGAGHVLLAKDPEGVSEVANDLHFGLTRFWKVLQDERSFELFRRIVEAVPFSEVEWQDAMDWFEDYHTHDHTHGHDDEPAIDGVAFFVFCRQSLAGRMKAFAPLTRARTRRGMNEQVSAWLSAVEGLPVVHERLKRVAILNRPALEVIRLEDGPETLFYCDPPYVHTTRKAEKVYAHEMTTGQHKALLKALRQASGKVILSGYPSELYDRELSDWHRVEFDLPNNAAGGKAKRRMIECVWMNYSPSAPMFAKKANLDSLFPEGGE